MLNGKTSDGAMIAAVPTLDQVAADARRAIGLPRETLKALLLRNAAAQSALTAALAAETDPLPAVQPDTLLSVDEAAAMLRRDRRWVYRHADSLPFIRRISGKSLLISENDLRHWLERRRP